MFSWHVNGIFPSGEDGSHINSVTGSEDGQYLATGDDFCLVRLFNDPCVDGSQARAYRAHGEHVTNVKFCGDKLFSTGGYDQSIMQWRIV
jgi:WD40 repeat protein